MGFLGGVERRSHKKANGCSQTDTKERLVFSRGHLGPKETRLRQGVLEGRAPIRSTYVSAARNRIPEEAFPMDAKFLGENK